MGYYSYLLSDFFLLFLNLKQLFFKKWLKTLFHCASSWTKQEKKNVINMGKTENFIQASFTKDKIIPQILISISVGQIFRTLCVFSKDSVTRL